MCVSLVIEKKNVRQCYAQQIGSERSERSFFCLVQLVLSTSFSKLSWFKIDRFARIIGSSEVIGVSAVTASSAPLAGQQTTPAKVQNNDDPVTRQR